MWIFGQTHPKPNRNSTCKRLKGPSNTQSTPKNLNSDTYQLPAIASYEPERQNRTLRRKSEVRAGPTEPTRYPISTQHSASVNPNSYPNHCPAANSRTLHSLPLLVFAFNEKEIAPLLFFILRKKVKESAVFLFWHLIVLAFLRTQNSPYRETIQWVLLLRSPKHTSFTVKVISASYWKSSCQCQSYTSLYS